MQSLETPVVSKKNAPGFSAAIATKAVVNDSGFWRSNGLQNGSQPLFRLLGGFQHLHSRPCLAEFADLFRVVMDHGGDMPTIAPTISSVQPTSEEGVHGVPTF
jgi:hypothetical protein